MVPVGAFTEIQVIQVEAHVALDIEQGIRRSRSADADAAAGEVVLARERLVGIEPGDVVVSVANQSVKTPRDVKMRVAAAQSQGRKSVLVLLSGSNGQRFVALKIA